MFKRYALSTSYWIAFFILAVWATFAYYTMHSLIKSEQQYGKLINLSGKQRMLSQRTALYAHLTLAHRTGTEELAVLIRQMKEDHTYIVGHLTSRTLHDHYFGSGGLDGEVTSYFRLLDAFVAEPDKMKLEAITRESGPLLANLNQAVSLFENENNMLVDELQRQEMFIYAGTLTTLLLEALLIVLPMVRRQNNYLAELEAEVKSRTKDIRIFANVYANTREGIIIADEGKRILNVNGAFTEITGYTEEEVVGKPVMMFASQRHAESVFEAIWDEVGRSNIWQGELIGNRKDGSEMYEHVIFMKLLDDGNTHYVTVFSDISERVHYEQKLHHMANHDSLTGLFNRSEILNRIDHAVTLSDRSGKSLAVVFIDLDNFKVINDSLGHDVGDRLLIEVAKLLSRTVRHSDTLGRLGGDEFVILLESLAYEGEELGLLEKLMKIFELPVTVDGRNFAVAASFGVVYYPVSDSSDCNAECLIRKADLAMYRAKELGKNRVAYYNSELEEKIQSQMLVKDQLSNAISNGELNLYLQPKVVLSDGSVHGAEALLKWRRNGREIPPSLFIAIAEEDDLIKKIDRWVLQETIRLCNAMRREGYGDISVAMNVSGRTFSDLQAVTEMLDTIEKSGAARQIEFEITERVLIENLVFASDIIQKIKGAGVRLSLDDFGTGYSSFSYLSRMPFDAIKIDRSFISALHEPKQKVLVEAMIAFSEKLGMHVIAEGIETREQLLWLRDQKCDLGQGLLFSEALPFEGFLKVLGTFRYEG